jgi:hypothetical protein
MADVGVIGNIHGYTIATQHPSLQRYTFVTHAA